MSDCGVRCLNLHIFCVCASLCLSFPHSHSFNLIGPHPPSMLMLWVSGPELNSDVTVQLITSVVCFIVCLLDPSAANTVLTKIEDVPNEDVFHALCEKRSFKATEEFATDSNLFPTGAAEV